MLRHFRRLGALRLGTLGLLAACSASEPPRATSVLISLPVTTVLVGETQQATAQLLDQNGDDFATSEPTTWTATPATLAQVAADGAVTGVAPGEIELGASIAGISGAVLVQIAAPFAVELTLETDGSGPPIAGQSQCAYSTRIAASGGRGEESVTITGITFEAVAESGAVDRTVIPSDAINSPTLARGESKTLSGVNQSPVSDPTVEMGVLVDYTQAGQARSLSATGPC